LYGGEGLDTSAGSYGGAVEGCSGTGEVELAIEGPVLEEAINEASVEDVPGSRGVYYWNEIGGCVVEVFAVESEDASLP